MEMSTLRISLCGTQDKLRESRRIDLVTRLAQRFNCPKEKRCAMAV